MPHRDLWLSPDHAVHVDAALIPVRYLVNGVTIARREVAEVNYFHVELDRHEVLLAEGLPAESYLDTGNRCAFVNGGGVAPLDPDFAWRTWDALGCAPLVLGGAALTAVRRRLLERALRLGFAVTDDPALHLGVGGQEVWPTVTAAGNGLLPVARGCAQRAHPLARRRARGTGRGFAGPSPPGGAAGRHQDRRPGDRAGRCPARRRASMPSRAMAGGGGPTATRCWTLRPGDGRVLELTVPLPRATRLPTGWVGGRTRQDGGLRNRVPLATQRYA